MSLVLGEQRLFTGVYVAHWEVPRFEVVTCRRLLGLPQYVERCQLLAADGVDSLHAKLSLGDPNLRYRAAAVFDVSFDGRVIERGHFGHRGWCRWRILVARWEAVSRR